MINTISRKVKRQEDHVISVTCDKCKKVIHTDDYTEIQEMHHVRFTGGYGSVFGDESKVECDLCQQCLKEVIGQYCRVDGEAL
jgi:hypothetical protein